MLPPPRLWPVADAASASPPVWNIANALTVLRVALVPVFAVVLLAGGADGPLRWLALAIFILAAATDRVDGWLARRNGIVTDFGKLWDPIADKLLMGTALVCLSIMGELWWWVTAVILARELGITVMRFFLLRYLVLPASKGGKLKTFMQTIAIGLFLLPLSTLPAFVSWLACAAMAVAVALTVVTGLDYVRVALRVRREARAAGR